jgi:hypothetical protein
MMMEHNAEEARYQDLVGKRRGRQHKDCQIIATGNLGYGLQYAAPLSGALMGSIGCALTNSRYTRSPENFLITR